MTKFLDPKFTVPYMSKAYRDNHSAVFGERKACKSCGAALSPTASSEVCYACEMEAALESPGATIKVSKGSGSQKAQTPRKTQARRK